MVDPATVTQQQTPSGKLTPALPTVSVVMLAPLRSPSGGHWSIGDRAGFPPDVAKDLIARGVARIDASPPPRKDDKGLDSAPADKMLRSAPMKKMSL